MDIKEEFNLQQENTGFIVLEFMNISLFLNIWAKVI
jgi:hypothetical protein